MLALDNIFFFAAIAGGALFVVQLVLMFVGGTADVDVDLDADLSLDGDMGHAASDLGFKVLSLQGITAFVMMFGLVGWAMRAEQDAGPMVALAAACAAGAASTWVIAKIFQFFNRLQSTGTLDMKKAVGTSGQVYLKIGPNKPGKVSITVGNRLLTLEGVTDKGETLETGTPIKVVRVISDTCVSVERN